ncbi:hypothetical protein CERZMDRAFT_33393 [Cercospora zeae-maydis SCOH1-5]|uniref:Methyltransferase domain-containing protein n=1 Tax=Cercospora zeae-maydis SCOH1-5 TaxID=717836 RepID=A0A6A6FS57_9PEZI|nr:hypothetical protein CERZMDRAFT_33393 [Cercospora zeae-maydis SCOH1-5]
MPIPKKPQTEGSVTFDPGKFFDAWSRGELTAPYDNDFRKFTIKSFGLRLNDQYGYRATTEVTLLAAQSHVEAGAANGLHTWYRDTTGQPRPNPNATDVAAYTDIFRPTTVTSKAITAFASNAKKGTVRADIAKHLHALYAPPDAARKLQINKSKSHINPYFDISAWAFQNLEWAGPEERTVDIKYSHAILPVLYHHFGCVCPSYESLSYVHQVARGRPIFDIGSGNGYWTYMLRRLEVQAKKQLTVIAVDNGLSEWRTMWIGDTIEADGHKWLQQNQGGKDGVLLLVYPMVGMEFTSKMIKAYKGTTIVSAGAQNASGFTAFAKETIADWMARELPAWEKVLQVPLPSFPGKDEALFIFEKQAETNGQVSAGA